MTLLGLFGAPRSGSAPGELRPPCHPLVTPTTGQGAQFPGAESL